MGRRSPQGSGRSLRTAAGRSDRTSAAARSGTRPHRARTGPRGLGTLRYTWVPCPGTNARSGTPRPRDQGRRSLRRSDRGRRTSAGTSDRTSAAAHSGIRPRRSRRSPQGSDRGRCTPRRSTGTPEAGNRTRGLGDRGRSSALRSDRGRRTGESSEYTSAAARSDRDRGPDPVRRCRPGSGRCRRTAATGSDRTLPAGRRRSRCWVPALAGRPAPVGRVRRRSGTCARMGRGRRCMGRRPCSPDRPALEGRSHHTAAARCSDRGCRRTHSWWESPGRSGRAGSSRCIGGTHSGRKPDH